MNAPTTALVPVARHTIFSPRAQGDFLEHLSINGNVRLACKAARVSAQTAYRARRKSAQFSALWDAALLSARDHAGQVLAERALNGVEEAVFYHGEEVATRTRYSDRLLLAHLARLDRLAERAEVAEAVPLLDAAIDSLQAGEELAEKPTNISPLDRVPSVPSCRDSLPSSSGCEAQPQAEPIGQTENLPLEERLAAMDAARPRTAASPYMLAGTHPYLTVDDIEEIQLAAFEDGAEEWWLILPTEQEWVDICAQDAADAGAVWPNW